MYRVHCCCINCPHFRYIADQSVCARNQELPAGQRARGTAGDDRVWTASARPVPLCGSNLHHAEWGESSAATGHREYTAEGGQAEKHNLRLRWEFHSVDGCIFYQHEILIDPVQCCNLKQN